MTRTWNALVLQELVEVAHGNAAKGFGADHLRNARAAGEVSGAGGCASPGAGKGTSRTLATGCRTRLPLRRRLVVLGLEKVRRVDAVEDLSEEELSGHVVAVGEGRAEVCAIPGCRSVRKVSELAAGRGTWRGEGGRDAASSAGNEVAETHFERKVRRRFGPSSHLVTIMLRH